MNANLDKLTIMEILKYTTQGFELVINDGHVSSLVQTKEDKHELDNNERTFDR